ncbi:MAG: hypothetical protein AB1714_11795 [Acidobacteriota bacterium]
MGIKTSGKLLVSFVSFLLVHLPTLASALPSFSINDVTVEEGNLGYSNAELRDGEAVGTIVNDD